MYSKPSSFFQVLDQHLESQRHKTLHHLYFFLVKQLLPLWYLAMSSKSHSIGTLLCGEDMLKKEMEKSKAVMLALVYYGGKLEGQQEQATIGEELLKTLLRRTDQGCRALLVPSNIFKESLSDSDVFWL